MRPGVSGRRPFFRLCSAAAAFLASPQQRRVRAAPQHATGAAKLRKNFVAIQARAYACVDKGIDQLLDTVQQKSAVKPAWANTYDYAEARTTKDGTIPLPDHGKAGSPEFAGGAFYHCDPKYFRDTSLTEFRSPDYGKFNVIAEVAPKAKAHRMDFSAWDYNNAVPVMNRNIPNFAKVAEIDIYDRRTTSLCFNHPEYRAHLEGSIQSLLAGYPSEVDGIAWGCERMGPFQNAIGGTWNIVFISCFCEHCRTRRRENGVSAAHAPEGYRKLDELFRATAQDKRPVDGSFVTFWHLLQEYPEILSREKLWTDSYHEVLAELYGVAKPIAPEKPFGFHIMQKMTFSPFSRAEEDYSRTKDYADYLKLATYNNAGGPRMASYLDRLSATIFHEASPKDVLPFYYKIMNCQEGPVRRLAQLGLDGGLRGAREQAGDRRDRRTSQDLPGDRHRCPHPPEGQAHHAGRRAQGDSRRPGSGRADGFVLSREYVEMWLANLAAAGETLRAVWGKA